MIQPIYIYGSEVLRAKAEDIDLNDKEYISNLVKDLKETLAHADGCGLAAPQIGVSKRALIVDGTGMVDVYDYLKDKRDHPVLELIENTEESEEKTDESIWNNETLEELACALEKLPQIERDVIILIYYHGKPKTEVAKILDITYGQLRYLHDKALSRLKETLSRHLSSN